MSTSPREFLDHTPVVLFPLDIAGEPNPEARPQVVTCDRKPYTVEAAGTLVPKFVAEHVCASSKHRFMITHENAESVFDLQPDTNLYDIKIGTTSRKPKFGYREPSSMQVVAAAKAFNHEEYERVRDLSESNQEIAARFEPAIVATMQAQATVDVELIFASFGEMLDGIEEDVEE